MRNFIQPGSSLAVTVPGAGGVTSGQGVLVGALFGVAAVAAAQNAVIEAATAGVRVFRDNAKRRATTTATGDFCIGLASRPARSRSSMTR